MAKTMTPSAMTDDQIDKAVNQLRAAMRKHRKTITSDVAQQVLGLDNLGMVLSAPFRERAEAISNVIVRRVRVDRTRTPKVAFDATGRNFYGDAGLLDSMPGGGDTNEEEDIHFLKPRASSYDKNGLISDEGVAAEFEFYGFEPDSFGQAAVNEADPDFATERPNGTQWKNAAGKWCFAAFDRWLGERDVHVGLDRGFWDLSCWFAGRRPVKTS